MREKDFENCGKSILINQSKLFILDYITVMILMKFRSEPSLLSPLQYDFNRVFLMTVVIVIYNLFIYCCFIVRITV